MVAEHICSQMLCFHSLASVAEAARTNNGELTGELCSFDYLTEFGPAPSGEILAQFSVHPCLIGPQYARLNRQHVPRNSPKCELWITCKSVCDDRSALAPLRAFVPMGDLL